MGLNLSTELTVTILIKPEVTGIPCMGCMFDGGGWKLNEPRPHHKNDACSAPIKLRVACEGKIYNIKKIG